MKKILFGLFSVLFTISLFNCEKDDICEEGTPITPRMIIEFYDNNNPTNKKSVTDLKVTANGITSSLEFNAVSKIELPLKVNENTVNYSFVLNSKSSTIALEDKIDINYTRKDVYISRACGYKTVFTLNSPNGMVLNTPKKWIQEIAVQESTIENENETHVKIYF